jgi:hypothetical protein
MHGERGREVLNIIRDMSGWLTDRELRFIWHIPLIRFNDAFLKLKTGIF